MKDKLLNISKAKTAAKKAPVKPVVSAAKKMALM